MATSPAKAGTLSPFRYRVFLALWTASLVMNLGNAIQAVSASWLMTSLTDSADMVALVQSATALPIMLFALIAGAFADLFDRRLLMLAAQGLMLAAAIALATFSQWGAVTPWLLLALTFLLGTGAAFSAPPMQATIGDVVPRDELAGAVSLNILGFNVARSVGPAIGGAIVAAAGASTAFALNALAFLASVSIIASWKRPPGEPRPHRERVFQAILDGLQYVSFAPAIRPILIRAIAFTFLGSAAWALMPLIARDLVGGGAFEFGWLLGGLGFGAVIGALASTAIRKRFRNETLVRAAGLIYGAACLAVAAKPGFAATLILLVVGGAGWVQALSSFSVTGQIWSPRWVVGRVAATINSVMFGGIALGSWVWGHVTDELGIASAIGLSGLAMVALPLLGLYFRLPGHEASELDPVERKLPDGSSIDPRSGPIVVTVEYWIDPEDAATFTELMAQRKANLRRDGARRWSLLQDMERPERWVERFQRPTWADCVRHHQRATRADLEVEQTIAQLHEGGEPPQASYLVARRTEPSQPVAFSVLGEPALPAAD
jgi:MFS family permease